MELKRKIFSMCVWVLLAVVSVDCSLSQEKILEVGDLTTKGIKTIEESTETPKDLRTIQDYM